MNQQKSTHNYHQSAIFILLLLVNILSCSNGKDVDYKRISLTIDEAIQVFNSKGRWARFENTNLIFGDTISQALKKTFLFAAVKDGESGYKIHRKSAFKLVEEKDTFYHFMYGLSIDGINLEELRIKVCQKDKIITDTLLLSKQQFDNYTYDYQLRENYLSVIAFNEKRETHLTPYLFEKGKIINRMFIPDTIFKRQDLVPDMGRRVIIYENFENKTLSLNGKAIRLTGKIHRYIGGGKSCPAFMMIKLDKKGIVKSGLVQTSWGINDITSLHELLNEELKEVECMSTAYFPRDEPVLLKERVYIEYL